MPFLVNMTGGKDMKVKAKQLKRGTAMLLSALMTFSSANLQTFALTSDDVDSWDLKQSETASGSNASRPSEDKDDSDKTASSSNALKEALFSFDLNEEKRFDRAAGSSDFAGGGGLKFQRLPMMIRQLRWCGTSLRSMTT